METKNGSLHGVKLAKMVLANVLQGVESLFLSLLKPNFKGYLLSDLSIRP